MVSHSTAHSRQHGSASTPQHAASARQTSGALRKLTCTIGSGAAAVGAAAWGAAPAHAVTAAQIGAEVQALRAQAEVATQQYDQAAVNLARLQQRVSGIQGQASALRARIDGYSGSLGRIAEAQYRGAGVDPTLQLMLAQQPDQYLQRAAGLNAAGRGEALALGTVLAQHQQLEQFQAQAAADIAAAAQAEQQAAAARGRIQAEYGQAQALLARLTSSQRWALDYSGVTPQQIDSVPAATGRTATAIAFVESKLGLWYEWGGTGTPSYDCSGLVQAAWAAAGVGLPRVTWSQLAVGSPVPAVLGDLRPGDLIFYLDGAHVAMYVGNGLVIHAPTTGQRIQYGEWDMMPITAVRRVLPGEPGR